MVNQHNDTQRRIHAARLAESARVAAGQPAEGCYLPPPPAAQRLAANHLRRNGVEVPAPAEDGAR